MFALLGHRSNPLQRSDMNFHYVDGKAIDQEGNMEGLLADDSADKLSNDNIDESPENRVSDIVFGLVDQYEKSRENAPFSENISTYEMLPGSRLNRLMQICVSGINI